MSKRSIDDIAGGAADSTVEDALKDNDATLTDEQLDALLPSDGFEVVVKPSGDEKQKLLAGVKVPNDPLKMTADEVEAFFVAVFGEGDPFDKMYTLDIAELEDLQGLADDINSGAESADAQKAGLKWSTQIAAFIA